MAQRDRVAADQHLFHDESKDLLPLAHVQGLGAHPELGAEPAEGLSELDVARVVHGRQLQRVEVRRDGPGLSLELRHPLAELGQGGQPVRVGAEEPLGARVQPRLFALQLCGADPQGIRRARHVAPARDLGVNQRRVVQDAQDLGPDEVIERVLADGRLVQTGPFRWR